MIYRCGNANKGSPRLKDEVYIPTNVILKETLSQNRKMRRTWGFLSVWTLETEYFANDSLRWSIRVMLPLSMTEEEAASLPNTSEAENNSCSNKTAIKRTNIWTKWRAHHWTLCRVSQCRLIKLMHVLLWYLLVPSLCSQSPELLAPFVLSSCLTYCIAMEGSVFWKWCIARAWTL